MTDYRTRTDRFNFQRDPDNGMVVGPSGCHYATEAHAMYFDQTKLCVCGQPEEVHQLLLDCLRQFAGEDRPKPGMKAIEALVLERPAVVAEFIAHFLGSADLTEHWGSVYGCWLTERGKQFLECGVMHFD